MLPRGGDVELLLKDRWSSQAERRRKGSGGSERMRRQGQVVEEELRAKWMKRGRDMVLSLVFCFSLGRADVKSLSLSGLMSEHWKCVVCTGWSELHYSCCGSFSHLFFCTSSLSRDPVSYGKPFLAGGLGGTCLKRISALPPLNVYFSAVTSRASWDSALAPAAFGLCSGRLFHDTSGLIPSPSLLCRMPQTAAMWLLRSYFKVGGHCLPMCCDVFKFWSVSSLKARSDLFVLLNTYSFNCILARKCRLWNQFSKSVGYRTCNWSNHSLTGPWFLSCWHAVIFLKTKRLSAPRRQRPLLWFLHPQSRDSLGHSQCAQEETKHLNFSLLILLGY